MSTNSFKIKNSAVLTPKDLSTLVTPEAGEIACDINDSNKIKRYDAASSSWVEVGSGGVGSVDIMFVQDFESASLSSFTQTGLSLSTTNPLHGKVSALLTHQAAVNQSFKQVVAVDPKFRGQAMVLDLNVKSSASAGNVVIKVRDESNSSDLIASEALQLSNDVSGRRSSVSFTIPSTCSSLSYTITALPQAGSPVTRIDDIVAMLSDVSLLETSVVTPNITAWQGYTPTFQGFGTPSAVEFEWRQVGENVEIRGKFTSGAATGVEARIGLPSGLTSAGTSIIPSLQQIGTGSFSGVTAGQSFAILQEPSVSYMTIGGNTGGLSALSKSNGNAYFSTGTILSFFASVPCAGLSATSTKTIPLTQSGLVQEADSAIRLYGQNGFGSTNTKIARFTTIDKNIGSNILYQDSATLGASFTVLVSGVYSIEWSVDAVAQRQVGLSVNSTQLTTNINSISSTNILAYSAYSAGLGAVVSYTGNFYAGDVIRPHTDGGAIATTYNFSISRQGSLKQVAVSSDQKITIPTSELRFEGASARGSTATAIVKFDTMAKLRGDAFTVESDSVLGTRITMKKAGKLDVSSSLYAAAAGQQIAITKNSSSLIPATIFNVASELLACEYTTGTNDALSISYSGFVSVGDIIRIAANIAITSNTLNNLNLSFQEQDISVSVTNTLPQFSESDSSVRVDTTNGYGSTATKIRRFSNVRDSIGTDIAYNDGSQGVPAQVGDYFIVKSSGIYSISYTDIFSVAGFLAISKNASSLTTNASAISGSERLADSNSATANFTDSVSWTGYLLAGDIIRAHTDGTTSGVTPATAAFTISKVGKPNVTGVNVTPFVNVPQPENQAIEALSQTNTFGGTNTGVPVLSINRNTSNGILAVVSNSTDGTSFIALKRCRVSSTASMTASLLGTGSLYWTRNATTLTATTPNGTISQSGAGASGPILETSVDVMLEAGDVLRVQRNSTNVQAVGLVTILAEALSDQILTAPETFSTDTASLAYAGSGTYTLSTLANAPVGTFITFTYAANTNTRTQTLNTAPSQTTADMNANGIQLFTRAYNAPSTAASPAAVAIQIGKGLKGRSLNLYKSAGKVIAGNLNYFIVSSTASKGARTIDYNEITGILIVDAAQQESSTNNNSEFMYSDQTGQSSGYLVINASKNPALTGLGLQTVSASYYTTAGASIANGTPTVINFASQTFDTNGSVTTGAAWRFTSPESGYYEVSSAVAFSIPVNTRYQVQLTLRKNAVDYQSNYISATQNTTNNGVGVNGTYLVYLIKGDYIDMTITQDTGAARNMGTTASQNFINIKKVSI